MLRETVWTWRTALAVILTEVDKSGREHQRGLKTITIPAHHYPNCRDILVRCIKFVLPEDLNVSGGVPGRCVLSEIWKHGWLRIVLIRIFSAVIRLIQSSGISGCGQKTAWRKVKSCIKSYHQRRPFGCRWWYFHINRKIMISLRNQKSPRTKQNKMEMWKRDFHCHFPTQRL